MNMSDLMAAIQGLVGDPSEVAEIEAVIRKLGLPDSAYGDEVAVECSTFRDAVADPFLRITNPDLDLSADHPGTVYLAETLRTTAGRDFQVQRRFSDLEVQRYLADGTPHSEPAVRVREILGCGSLRVSQLDIATTLDDDEDEMEDFWEPEM